MKAAAGALSVPATSRQVIFHQLLVAARKTWLSDALSTALASADPNVLKSQLSTYVPVDVQRALASSGIRDEHVFPTPAILEAKPTLVGYYRLLLGVSQKRFYRSDTGMSSFKTMETRDVLGETQRARLQEFCAVMSRALSDLIRQMSPAITSRDVTELQLLTLGAQFYGSNNNAIGQQAIRDVFLSIREIVREYIIGETERRFTIRNAAGRTVTISLASDPDVRIQEDVGGRIQNKVAVEVKGGTDQANVHNRAGEAEKSHQKAKAQGFRDFWTIIAKKGLVAGALEAESPTTNSWFHAAEVLGRSGKDWQEFSARVAGQVGIPLKPAAYDVIEERGVRVAERPDED